MRLKRIKLAGFKSFVEPTIIPFPNSMTAVVGPNGCGKSNVIDAVRWVLGESSAKNLRGDAMTDVIFNGSTNRKPLGQCSVELIFENAGERLTGEYAKYTELSVKRLVTRDGQSNYFLNSTKCRRRDVTDLFLGTGLGPRSYAIIEQGMISRLIESKPQELRVFIEEAAGVSKYKERRKETETRIRHTLENLERLSDVRSELGLQLNKLEQQAQTAKQYTELKATERTLKSELALIRYMALEQKMAEIRSSCAKVDTEYESLKAQLHHEEAQLEKLITLQTTRKMELDVVQEKLFSLATQVNRVEEAALFKTERVDQLNTSLKQLDEKQSHSRSLFQQASEKLSAVDKLINNAEPELARIEDEHEVALSKRDAAEFSFQEFMQVRRLADASYHDKKREAQERHSQIQSTTSMQTRTQQRIRELNEELSFIQGAELEEQNDSLQKELNDLKSKHLELTETQLRAKQTEEALRVKRKEQESLRNTMSDKIRTLNATLSGLASIDKDSDRELLDSNLTPLWQHLKVESGYESLVELVLSHYSSPLLMNCDENEIVNKTLPKGRLAVFNHSLVTNKPTGTLSTKITSKSVPFWFTQIYLADSFEDACDKLDEIVQNDLAQSHSVLTLDCVWLSPYWKVVGAHDSATGAMERQVEMSKLKAQIERLSIELKAQEKSVEKLIEQEHVAIDVTSQISEELESIALKVTEITQNQHILTLQLKQRNERRNKIADDIEQQNELLDQEMSQLTSLSEQVESLDKEILALEIKQQDAETKSAVLQKNIADTRTQYDVVMHKKHQLNLSQQTNLSQREAQLNEQMRLREQLKEYQEQIANTVKDMNLLNDSESDNGEKLQGWLQEKGVKEEQKIQLQQAISQLDGDILKAKEGIQNIQNAIEKKRKNREKLLLELEGVKARTTTILEQLKSENKSVEEIRETMPKDAHENMWVENLESVSVAIAQIGAVNLAAIDEFKTQAERKAHLDEQDEDLNNALDTLKSAIRKIDKETRNRFGETFEQVNTDLKSLFPKVFGGGSAYLALTDDDLLETGVTIMARPPGKKNSTIHLLSGGEKALTALSLVFAIFRLNPAPFCLLDEVDAPLDDANVGRFCNLVSEMSQSVQFIYITHNKIAMEMANTLTGVTMAEPGVSRMVAVDVDEAVSMAQT
ncbi:chromosome segregation protein SMC [Alteromonas sp. 5E99-2]|uniref:chromosome segregation protein SMC n=1 Tax=Alteromonas sp. 5E99-2 TaxID=2817683 RepID=UPI001A984C0C|nr:chromosome segregation protein SMC [Alteromonas sp. 5E99-2]MBO1255606.1 chromosome segregation protein SMC [Alteromonas sp. 5E99-2]